MKLDFIEYIFSWIKDRVTERTSLDGTVLVFIGLVILFAKPIIHIAAYIAILYGLYTIIMEEK